MVGEQGAMSHVPVGAAIEYESMSRVDHMTLLRVMTINDVTCVLLFWVMPGGINVGGFNRD